MAKRKITTQLHVDKSKDAIIGEIKRLSNLELTIQVFENSAPLVVDNQEIYVECYRADGSLAKQEVDITGTKDTIICNLKNGVFSFPGIAEIDLTLKDSEGQMTTASLFIKVTGRAVEVDPSTPENYLPDLTEMIGKFQTAMNEVIDSNSLKGDKAISDFITSGDEIISTFSLNATTLLNTFNDDSTDKLSQFTTDTTALKKQFILDTEKLKEDFNITSSNAIDSFTLLTQSVLTEFEQLSLRYINDFNDNGNSAITNFNRAGDAAIADINTNGTNTIDTVRTTGEATITDIQKRGNAAIASVTEKGTAVEEYFKANIDNFKGEQGEPGYVNVIDSFEGGKDVALSGNKGKELAIRVDDIENKGAMWQEHTGTGTITINDTLYGSTKDLVIKGKTVGGYNAETAQSDSIVSSAEQEGNKLIVKSCGKNLFDYKSLPFQDNIGGYNDRNLKQIPNGFRVETLWATSLPLTINLGLKAGKTYTSSYNLKIIEESLGAKDTGGCKIVLRKGSIGNYTYLYLSGINGSNWTFKCPDDIDDYTHLMFYSHGGGGSYNGIVEITNFQLEEGTLATKYEDYVENKLEQVIPWEGGLKECDSIDLENGKAYEGMKKYTVTGNESISYTPNQSTGETAYFSVKAIDENGKINGKCLSNNFKRESIWGTENEGFRIEGDATKTSILRFRILKTKLETPNVEGFKKWLKENQTIVIYELETPVIHNIDKLALTTFTGKTHINQENSIPGEISCKAKVNIAAQNIRLKTENENLKKDLNAKSEYFHSNDLTLTHSDLELDFRMMEIEFALDIPININEGRVNSMAARTPYEMMKVLILGGSYDRTDLEYKISVYVKRNRMTQDEADELIALMDAKDVI